MSGDKKEFEESKELQEFKEPRSTWGIVLVLVVVLVLEEAGAFNEAYLFPRPGGEPLWRVSHDLAIFVLASDPAKECEQQAAPGNNPA